MALWPFRSPVLPWDHYTFTTTPPKISQTQNGALKKTMPPSWLGMVIAFYTRGSWSSFPLYFLSLWLPAVFFYSGVLRPRSPARSSLVSGFPSFPVPHSLLQIWKTIWGRLPQLHCLAAGVERMNEWLQSQTRPRRMSCLFGKHPPAPGKRKPGRQRARVPFASVELRDHQLAQGKEPRPDRAMEQSLLRSRLPSCRGAFSVLLSKGAAGKLPARPTRSLSGRWRALAKGTAWAALFSFFFLFWGGVTRHHYRPARSKKPSGHGLGNKQQPFPSQDGGLVFILFLTPHFGSG